MDSKAIIENMFGFGALVVFLVSAMVLLFVDCKNFKKKNMKREYKTAKFFGVFYIVIGVLSYFAVRFFVK